MTLIYYSQVISRADSVIWLILATELENTDTKTYNETHTHVVIFTPFAKAFV